MGTHCVAGNVPTGYCQDGIVLVAVVLPAIRTPSVALPIGCEAICGWWVVACHTDREGA
jgi:hypothetical protein